MNSTNYQPTEELYFNVELRNCLDAAGFSDCGKNDQWNWWYQRLHQAHDAAVDSVTNVQRNENAKLREYCSELLYMVESNDPDFLHWPELYDELQKLGVEVVKF